MVCIYYLTYICTNKETNKQIIMMTVKLNKISSVITEKSVKSFKTRKELFTFLSGLNHDFKVICDKSISEKISKKLESFGFGVGQDSDYGFDFEVKLYAFINN